MNPLRLLIIWIALLWTVSNFLTAFWDWHVPNWMQLFWCSLNSAVEIVAGTCQRDSWENQMLLASSLVSIRKDNDLASPDWSIFIFTLEITSWFAFLNNNFYDLDTFCILSRCSSHWSEQLYWVLLFYFDSPTYTYTRSVIYKIYCYFIISCYHLALVHII